MTWPTIEDITAGAGTGKPGWVVACQEAVMDSLGCGKNVPLELLREGAVWDWWKGWKLELADAGSRAQFALQTWRGLLPVTFAAAGATAAQLPRTDPCALALLVWLTVALSRPRPNDGQLGELAVTELPEPFPALFARLKEEGRPAPVPSRPLLQDIISALDDRADEVEEGLAAAVDVASRAFNGVRHWLGGPLALAARDLLLAFVPPYDHGIGAVQVTFPVKPDEGAAHGLLAEFHVAWSTRKEGSARVYPAVDRIPFTWLAQAFLNAVDTAVRFTDWKKSQFTSRIRHCPCKASPGACRCDVRWWVQWRPGPGTNQLGELRLDGNSVGLAAATALTCLYRGLVPDGGIPLTGALEE